MDTKFSEICKEVYARNENQYKCNVGVGPGTVTIALTGKTVNFLISGTDPALLRCIETAVRAFSESRESRVKNLRFFFVDCEQMHDQYERRYGADVTWTRDRADELDRKLREQEEQAREQKEQAREHAVHNSASHAEHEAYIAELEQKMEALVQQFEKMVDEAKRALGEEGGRITPPPKQFGDGDYE